MKKDNAAEEQKKKKRRMFEIDKIELSKNIIRMQKN